MSDENRKVNIGGIDVEVVSDDKMQEIANTEGIVLMCLPTSLEDIYVVPDSTVEKCNICNCDVWMSPATKLSTPKNAVVACLNCVSEGKAQKPSGFVNN